MEPSEYILVRRADLATHMTKAPTVYPAWSDAHDRLRAALSADQVEDVAQVLADLGRHAGPGGWPNTSRPGRVNEGHRQKARALLDAAPDTG